MASMDQHYWDEVARAEQLRDELIQLATDDSRPAMERRAVLAAELSAFEAHLQRELMEASYLALGHRIT